MSTASTPSDSEEMQSLRTAPSGQILIRIPYARIFVTSTMLALGSITISTTIGYALHFKGMTATQCGPRNHKLCYKKYTSYLVCTSPLLSMVYIA